MATETELGTDQQDSAAVFACAFALWEAVHKQATNETMNLSECYNGLDQLMREVMRVGNLFEAWACRCVSFEALDDVWPYLLQDSFGDACLEAIAPQSLTAFNESDCLRVAIRLRLPINIRLGLPVPVDVTARNPVANSQFRVFRIQTVRDSIDDEATVPFTPDDEPFDGEFGSLYFALYGVGEDNKLEHIADRQTYADARGLAEKLAPGVEFPDEPATADLRGRKQGQ